jgi:hypothetical protein
MAQLVLRVRGVAKGVWALDCCAPISDDYPRAEGPFEGACPGLKVPGRRRGAGLGSKPQYPCVSSQSDLLALHQISDTYAHNLIDTDRKVTDNA